MSANEKNVPDDALADLGAHRDALYRYALLQLRDATLAEDLVQATFLSALQARASFRGDSSLRTWLIGILKRKVIDYFRAQSRDAIAIPDLAAGNESDEDFLDRVFASNDRWVTRPQAWSDPDQALDQEEFWLVLETCMRAVPGIAGRAFLLRELVGLEAEEICKDLEISRSNYWVLMHRARIRLRDCLDKRWFMGTRENESS